MVLSAQTLPVLMVIADQQDFYYKEYNDTRTSLEAGGVDVQVAATTTSPSTPHQNSGWLGERDCSSRPRALSQVNEDDYSAIVFVGGWGSSMYQSTAFPGDYFNDHYDGDIATKTLVNNLIGEFDASEKYLGFICHATTIAAWSCVNGVSLIAGKQVSAVLDRLASPTTESTTQTWHWASMSRPLQTAYPNGCSRAIRTAGTATDDVVVDGRVITAENWDSALQFGETIADLVNAAAEVDTPPVNQAPTANDAVSISEDAALGRFNGTGTRFPDPDAGQTLTYSIVSGNTGGAFAIDAVSGVDTMLTPQQSISRKTNPVSPASGSGQR